MIRHGRTLAVAVLGLSAFCSRSAEAQQMRSQGPRTILIKPDQTVVERQTIVVRKRRPWRDRNPYFVNRPTYTPAVPGERARVTFQPFTSLYYPKENSYYPSLDAPTVVHPR